MVSGAGPTLEDTKDIDDWLAVTATGRAVGITPESTITQCRRDPHPATHAAVAS